MNEIVSQTVRISFLEQIVRELAGQLEVWATERMLSGRSAADVQQLRQMAEKARQAAKGSKQ